MFACARRPIVAVLLVLAGALSSGQAEQISMNVNGLTNPPVGYLEFCRSFPGECKGRGGDSATRLDKESWRGLREVNSFVNHSVMPATDLDFYQRDELWTLPNSYGDCEDYVLLKRRFLAERGWPTGALLVTVVFDEVGDGHAVLMVRTNRGDFVLDNKTDEIKIWHETAYRFVKRQSVSDPNRWVSLGDPRWSAQSTAAPR
jgi:predicted transglutaminase-like cysteine proteinase